MKRDPKPSNVHGNSRDPNRGTWCTPKEWAERVGRFDLDPFSNPRSHIDSAARCMLERGDNGLHDPSRPGSYRRRRLGCASSQSTVFLQPPYTLALEAIAHYGHTRFCALLRFDTSTEWFRRIYRLSQLVCVSRERINFEPPPGVTASTSTFPHAFFYARVEDATPAVLRACIAWRP